MTTTKPFGLPFVLLALIVLFPAAPGMGAAQTIDFPDQKPELTADGQIICGTKSIKQKYMSSPHHALDVILQGEDQCTGSENMNLGAGDAWSLNCINRKELFSGNSTILTGDARAGTSSLEKLGTYKLSLTYLENGLAKVESRLMLDDPSKLKSRSYTFSIPEYLALQGVYSRDGKTVAFDKTINKSFGADEIQGLKITFFPDNQDARFSIQPDQCSRILFINHRVTFYPDTNGIIGFFVDISGGESGDNAETAPNGINLWTVDRLHFPDYNASSNLVQNPSFESGLRYWAYRIFAEGAMPLKYTNIYELDTTVAHSGQNALRIRALAINNTLPLGNYPLPFVVGENYTLSFYAKGSVADGLTLNVHGRGGRHNLPFGTTTNRSSQVGAFAIGKEWKRYSFSFNALETFITMYFTAKASSPAAEGYVWVDDVQVEKGAMTAFKQAPHAMQLISTARGNFLEFGQSPDFRLAVQSRPNAAGTVSLFVEDFFFRTVLKQDFAFNADAAGKATITLPALDAKVTGGKLRGVFAVTATLQVADDARPYKDYFRFSVMNFLENKHRNKNIFCINFVYALQPAGPDYERFLAHERAIGIGSVHGDFIGWGGHVDYDREEERIRLMERYGIDQIGKVAMDFYSKESRIEDKKSGLVMTNICNRLNPTAAELAEFEHICEMKAKNRPWFNLWWFTAESNPGIEPLQSHPEAFAKFLIATMRGIKKGNPDAKVLVEGGPWTIAPTAGNKWMERYIQDIKKIDPSAISGFDGVGGHYYCNIPESYDLDANIGEYIKMLGRNGCENMPLYLGEGGNYSPMHIPQLGISPYVAHSLNSWYISPFSYHLGRAERISATYDARTWLVGLKYQDRVKQMADFSTPTRYQDIDFTPRAYDKIPNTLGRILGDASFYKDIRFAPFCRCYVFKEDKTGAPIAVVWGHQETVDRWKEDPPKYKFNFGQKKLKFMDIIKLDFDKQDFKFIDLMENEVSFPKDADGFAVIPISPFPLFIKGAPGTEQKLCDAIAAAVPVMGAAGGVEVSAFPNADGKAVVVFTSKVSREYSGEAKVVINGVENKWPLKIPSLGSREELVTLAPAAAVPTAAPDGDGAHRPPIRNDGGRSAATAVLQKFTVEYAFAGGNTGKIAGDYILLKNQAGITVDGDLSDWKDLPANNLGAGVSMQAVVAGKKVIIAIRATGKNISAEDVFAGVGLYLDPFEKTDTWAEPKAVAGGTAGDYGVYEFQKTKGGGLEALCRFSQGTLAGMDKDLMIVGKVQKLITVKTAMSGDVACMEIEVPEKIFAPLQLEPGSRFGLNISVPLKDGGVATLAPVSGYKSVAEPGQINFVMAIVCK